MWASMRRNKKREASPRDKTLWIASHRDSVITIVNRITLSREESKEKIYLIFIWYATIMKKILLNCLQVPFESRI